MRPQRDATTTATGEHAYRSRTGFWLGVAAVAGGTALHLPMYIRSADMGYRLEGMPMGGEMMAGIALIVCGLAITAFSLVPARSPEDAARAANVRVRALDDAPLRWPHVALLLVMAIAVTIDVMKPVTLGFIAPGVAREYGLRSPLNLDADVPVTLLPMAGIVGTVIGSLLWGWLGDRVGRRSSILFAGAIFVGTSICGAMPSFEWNVVMCFVMGLGVGGMLPIAFALMAETMPARHRGWLMVLIGGDVAGAYLLTSWLSSVLTPDYGWRILWLLGLPTGILLILLNRWIPESPRFLIAQGRSAEAEAIVAHYGSELITAAPEPEPAAVRARDGWRGLFGSQLRGLTLMLAMFGIGIGIVTFGFQLWIPSNLQALGFDELTSGLILRNSALLGFPLTILVAWLYGFWSARGTLLALGALTAAALGVIAIVGDAVADDRTLLYVLLVMPIVGISSLLAVLVAYSAEIYPTTVRARGTGLAAAASKAGGVLVLAVVTAAATPPSIAVIALIGAIPLAVAALAVLPFGVETRRRTLEEITAHEFDRGPAATAVEAPASGSRR